MNNANPFSIVTNARNLNATVNIENSIINGNTANNLDVFYEYVKHLGVLRIGLASVMTTVTIENFTTTLMEQWAYM